MLQPEITPTMSYEKLKGVNLKKRIVDWLLCVPICTWLFAPGILSLVITYYLFTTVDQGIDILIFTSEQWGFGVYACICLFVWSFILWFSSRQVALFKDVKNNYHLEGWITHIPRLMAYSCFVIVQVAIFALPEVQLLFEVDFIKEPDTFSLYVFIYFWISLLFYFNTDSFFNKTYGSLSKRWLSINGIIFIIDIGLHIALWIYVIYLNNRPSKQVEHVRNLSIIAILLYVIQLVAVLLFIVRRKGFAKASIIETEIGTSKFAKKFANQLSKSNIVLNNGDWKWNVLFVIVFFVGLVLYFLAINVLDFANNMGTLSFLLLASGIITGFANLITFLSRLFRVGLNLFFIFILIPILIGLKKDPYKVRTISSTEKTNMAYRQRPNIDTYFHRWLQMRAADILDTTAHKQFYDVYLVLADGGALRSGYWAASVLSSIEQQSHTKGDTFSKHLLCLSGASGGSVGNTVFYSLLFTDSTGKLKRAQDFLSADFFSFTNSHLFGPDLIGHYFWFTDDRAGALEKSMEDKEDELYPGALSMPTNNYIDTTGKRPILFINTTEMQKGMPAIISTINTVSFSSRFDVLGALEDKLGGVNVRLSTAAILGARFPYISPAGSINKYYFVDGGYFDNSGAGIVHEMMIRIDKIIAHGDNSDTALYKRLRFNLLHLTNSSPREKPRKSISPMVNNLAAPLLTVLGTYGSQTEMNDSRLRKYFENDTSHRHITYPPINLWCDDTLADFSMNWLMSSYTRKRMDTQLHKQIKKFEAEKKFWY